MPSSKFTRSCRDIAKVQTHKCKAYRSLSGSASRRCGFGLARRLLDVITEKGEAFMKLVGRRDRPLLQKSANGADRVAWIAIPMVHWLKREMLLTIRTDYRDTL